MEQSILSQIVKTSDPARDGRIRRATEDFGYFCRTYLGHYFFSDFAEYQQILTRIETNQTLTPVDREELSGLIKEDYHALFPVTERIEGIVDVEPREHGKTVRQTLAKPLWRILTGRNRYILIVGASDAAARDNLVNIRTELEENEQLLEDFGEMKAPGKMWSDSRIELANGCCIQAKGAGSAMRGLRFGPHRPDLIILDDILKDEAAESPTQRDKLYRWAKRVIFFLGKNAFVVVVNTIFHSDDLPSRLLSEIGDGRLEGWVGLRFACFRPGGAPLWPQYWSAEDLEKKRRAVGSREFTTEMMNEPVSEEDSLFRKGWLVYESPSDVDLKKLRVYMGVDPATGAHDQSAIVTVGVDSDGVVHVLDSFGQTMSPDAFTKKLVEKYLIWQPRLIGWEDVSFQKIFRQTVMREAARAGTHMPIKGMSTKGMSKEARLSRLSPLVENGLVVFREIQTELIDQLLTFPKGTFDDQPDALYYAWEISQAGPAMPMVFSLGPPRFARRIARRFR